MTEKPVLDKFDIMTRDSTGWFVIDVFYSPEPEAPAIDGTLLQPSYAELYTPSYQMLLITGGRFNR